MARIRKPIEAKLEGKQYLAYFKHPVLKKTVCFALGDASEAITNKDALNAIFLNPALWLSPPAPPETPEKIYRQWMGHGNTITLAGDSLMRNNTPLKADSAEIARLQTALDAMTTRLKAALDKIEKQERELETWRGKKTSKAPSMTLEKAREKFMKAYKSGALSKKAGKIPDAHAVKNIQWDLERFTKEFGETTPADFIEGQEEKFSTWLHGLKNASGQTLSPTRRMQIRIYVLMMLEHAGAQFDRKKIKRPDTSESAKVNDTTKATNGINWLTKDEAEKVLAHLRQDWKDMLHVQCAIGLRPSELLTLHKNNFDADITKLTLAPLVFKDRYEQTVTLTLKTGPRVIPVPESIRDIIKARLKKNAVVFTGPDGTAWNSESEFYRQFKAALVGAAKKAKVKKPMDARIGRRSCASWLMQANVSADRVAALLGDSAEMILKHYGDPDTLNMDLSATEI